MTLVQEELDHRLSILARIRAAFLSLHPDRPLRVRRGRTQQAIFRMLNELDADARSCNLVSEALSELGYAKVRICGTLFYRRKAEVQGQ